MPMHIGESKVSASVAIGETFVIHPEEMQDCSLKIVNGDNIVSDLFAKFIAGPMNHSSFDAGTSKPTTKDPSVMPSSTHSGVGLERATAKFGGKNDKGILHKASIFQIFQHACNGLVHVAGELIVIAHVGMGIPVVINTRIAINQFHKTNTPLDQPASNHTLPPKTLSVTAF